MRLIRFEPALLLLLLWCCREPGGTSRPEELASKPPAAKLVAPDQPRDITVPPPDVDVHVINGRNILSARLPDTTRAAGELSGRHAPGLVRVTFWTTPEGSKLPDPKHFEGTLADLALGVGDLPMIVPGEKRRLWIPGPTGMATLDVELVSQ